MPVPPLGCGPSAARLTESAQCASFLLVRFRSQAPSSSFPPPHSLCGNCCVCPCQCKKSEHNVLPGIFIGLTTPQRLQGITKCKAHSQSSHPLSHTTSSCTSRSSCPSYSSCTSNSFELLSIHCGSPATPTAPTQPRPWGTRPPPPRRFVPNVQRKQHAIFFCSCSAFCMSFHTLPKSISTASCNKRKKIQ